MEEIKIENADNVIENESVTDKAANLCSEPPKKEQNEGMSSVNEAPVGIEKQQKNIYKYLLFALLGIIGTLVIIVSIVLTVVFLIPRVNVEETVDELIEDEEFADAYSFLMEHEKHKDYDDLEESIFEAHEEFVTELMDDGDYNEAYEVLGELPQNPAYVELKENIVSESWILTCAYSIRETLKNPRSLQISKVELYTPVVESADAKYAASLLTISSQNGFGGSASVIAICGFDLKYISSTEADGIVGTATKAVINILRNKTGAQFYPKYDLRRVNRMLSENVSTKLHLASYKEITLQEVS